MFSKYVPGLSPCRLKSMNPCLCGQRRSHISSSHYAFFILECIHVRLFCPDTLRLRSVSPLGLNVNRFYRLSATRTSDSTTAQSRRLRNELQIWALSKYEDIWLVSQQTYVRSVLKKSFVFGEGESHWPASTATFLPSQLARLTGLTE